MEKSRQPLAYSFDFAERWEQFTQMLYVRIWSILAFAAVTFFIVAVGTLLQTKIYRASATVLIDRESPTVLSVSTTRDESTLGSSEYLAYADYYQTQLSIITSRSVAQKVFDKLKLYERPRYTRAKDPILKLLRQVKVEPVKLTRMARIRVEDPGSQLAARIANEFAVTFVQENLSKTAGDETLILMKNEYLKLQSKEAELSKRYKNKFPAVLRTRQQMQQLAQLIDEETQRQLDEKRRHIEGEAIEGGEGLPSSLRERFRENSMVGGLKPNNIRIVDLAEIPKKTAKPLVPLNLFLGLFLGLLGGVGTAVAQEMIDNTLKSPKDFERENRFVCLGCVPTLNGLSPGSDNDLSASYQYIQKNPHSQIAEAYRVLRTRLLYSTPKEGTPILVITSPASGEGKTTTASNLAIALSQLGLKILLVDCDLRKPKIHEAFHLAQYPGLSEFLIGRISFEDVTRPTEIPGLWVTTSGAAPPNPADLLQSSAMKEFLKRAGSKFDRVLLDCPPIIPITDAVILAAVAGRVLAVVRSGKTPRHALHRLNEACLEVDARVLGVVLNDVSDRTITTYYGYSSYRYGYGQEGEKSRASPG